jgi:phytoene synthase
MIAEGSKSFSLAARLFDGETRNAAFFLYGWCRYCDDQVDSVGSFASVDLEARLQRLRAATVSALSGAPQQDAVFIALQFIARRYSIPADYPLELIEGMAMDVRGTRYPRFEDLLLYCYRVAGTVGLMMSHVMGLRNQRALEHASDLGIALQLTNIARDVHEDAARGRVYLPLEWLAEAGIPPDEIRARAHRDRLAGVARRLLARAEPYYRSADAGLWHLELRSACAVAAARQVYAEIGARVLQKGPEAWDERSYVDGSRKLVMAFRGIVQALWSVPARLGRPWAPEPITMVWHHSSQRALPGLSTGERRHL